MRCGVQIDLSMNVPCMSVHASAHARQAAGQWTADVLSTCPLLAQENYFFDGSEKELESQRAVMRLRFYDGNARATITVKVCCCCCC